MVHFEYDWLDQVRVSITISFMQGYLDRVLKFENFRQNDQMFGESNNNHLFWLPVRLHRSFMCPNGEIISKTKWNISIEDLVFSRWEQINHRKFCMNNEQRWLVKVIADITPVFFFHAILQPKKVRNHP